MERLLVVEHKLDALIATARVGVPPMASGTMCPACEQEIKYAADFMSKMILRSCGCGHGQQAPMLGFGDLNTMGASDGRRDQKLRSGPEQIDSDEG
jgi:hypothetical protein